MRVILNNIRLFISEHKKKYLTLRLVIVILYLYWFYSNFISVVYWQLFDVIISANENCFVAIKNKNKIVLCVNTLAAQIVLFLYNSLSIFFFKHTHTYYIVLLVYEHRFYYNRYAIRSIAFIPNLEKKVTHGVCGIRRWT